MFYRSVSACQSGITVRASSAPLDHTSTMDEPVSPVSPMTDYSIEQTVDEIMSYLKKAGTESYLGPQEESVTQLSHSLQAAALAATFVDSVRSTSTVPPPLFTSPSIPKPCVDRSTEALLYGSDIVLAALLHDVGHMILSKPDSWDSLHDTNEQHEWVGYHYLLRHHFSPQIALLVLGHVQAKRYLCYREPGYQQRLSDSSAMTLIGQGGPMTETEAVEFERGELFDVKLRMRVWDEEAKLENWKENGDEMDRYRDMMLAHLTQQRNKKQQAQPQAA